MHLVIGILIFGITNFLTAEPQETLKLVSSENAPYVSSSEEKGVLLEITEAALKKAGYQIKVDFFPWIRAKVYANPKGYHGILPLFGQDHFEDGFVTSDPILKNDLGILSKQSLDAKDGTDLYRYLAQNPSLQYSALRGDSIKFPFLRSGNLTLCSSNQQQIELLGLNRIDAAIIDKHIASDIIVNSLPHLINKLKFTNLDLKDPYYYLGFSKTIPDHLELRDRFNKALKEIRSSGEYHQIVSKYGFHRHENYIGKKNIVIGAVKTPETLAMKELSQHYQNKYPNIEIIWEILDETQLRNKLWGGIRLDYVPYDVITIGSFESRVWPRKKWIAPINTAAYDLNDFIKPVIDSMKYEDEVYGIPFYSESVMTYYRKDVFEKAGIAMPAQPTYQQILKYAKKIHDPKNNFYGIGIRGKPGWGQSIAFISLLVNTFGGRWFDRQWNPEIDSTEWRDALKFYKKLLEFAPPQPWELGWQENQNLFSKGKIGILVDATSLAGRLYDSKKSEVHDKIAQTKAPRSKYLGGEKWLWSWAFAIPANTSSKAEANSFIRWATSKEYVRLAARTNGWVSVPLGARYSTFNKQYKKVAPFADFVLQEIITSKSTNFTAKPIPYSGPQFVSIQGFPAIGKNVARNISLYVQDKLSLAEALADSQAFAKHHFRLNNRLEN
ncbi:extracellular solute-binding protein [Pseudobacteriovorax antillogorgiicola]|uniref:Sorbitol/mannitol transport system substrate-binding protein n=1 Tax=Pseudobacteriovorax antillogorgiicola TaxID=1513793 RepID=A0A1Y6CQV2_9BACT|nr:extracellular solute-binding protein [Pseudobacteriovorax antillogorgiicola]TCS42864.1 sorbitol/mannitol transport system substrate-binding protein [Pseudobacteriovorax antillogorgiicola]SMF82026.1 sorbitol/mannitol transport system substrate-binding protein [Pseudobacteriovorax antillogorgiicola]